MKYSVLILFSLLITKSFSQCVDSTNIYTFKFNDKKYEIVKEIKNYAAAAKCAVERGGYLAEINNKEEQKAIFDALIKNAKVSTTYVSVGTGGGIAYVWIGATDKKTEGIWLWDGNNDGLGVNFWMGQGENGLKNGKVMLEAFNNWGGSNKGKPNEPDNFASVQNCAGMALAVWPNKTNTIGIAGEWNDLLCATSLYFVIEYN